VWPASADRAESGALSFGGVPATALHAAYGTPLYVVDEQEVRDRATRIREAFTDAFAPLGVQAAVYYAGKASLTIEVARWMTVIGLENDVCSGDERVDVEFAEVDQGRVGLHGNIKSLTELDRAVEFGVGAIVLDSVVEIVRVARAAERYG